MHHTALRHRNETTKRKRVSSPEYDEQMSREKVRKRPVCIGSRETECERERGEGESERGAKEKGSILVVCQKRMRKVVVRENGEVGVYCALLYIGIYHKNGSIQEHNTQ